VTLDQVVKRVNGVKAQEETIASGSGSRRSEEERDCMVSPEQCTDVFVLYETNQVL
jgi:hypothetical protein